MEPIHALERLAQLIRKKADDSARANSRSKTVDGATLDGAAQPPSRASAARLEQDLRLRLRQMQQEGAGQAALGRLLVESVLAFEYSADLHNEPKFTALVQRVHNHIESDPALQRAFERVIAQMVK